MLHKILTFFSVLVAPTDLPYQMKYVCIYILTLLESIKT